MAPRKKQPSQIASEHIVADEPITVKATQPLVFISHDTRDGDIAEAFSKLLSNVSAGVLKSFRSSDRRGTQGIEYGVEWFPEIMKKLDESSDIVCLLTHHSVDRPWILYEAGVAKGKLSTTVLGVALGIPLSKANNGPFAQFQNCSDDEDSLTKLVIQLVKRIPNAEPVEEIVRSQVTVFKQKLDELLKGQPSLEKQEDSTAGASVAKLFEEIKVMFTDLPHRIDRRLDPDLLRRGRSKFRPMMLKEIYHFSTEFDEGHIGFLMLIGMIKEDFPWLYEVGIETYRVMKTGKSTAEKSKSLSLFDKALQLMRHPMMTESYGKSERQMEFQEEFYHMMQRFLSRYYSESSLKR